jgi:hypothetical protein
MNNEIETRLKLYFIHKLKQLSNEFSFKYLNDLLKLLDYIIDSESNYINQDFSDKFLSNDSISTIRHIFLQQSPTSIYSICLNDILGSLSNLSSHDVNLQSIKNMLIKIITSTNYSETFEILYDYCSNLR